MLYLKDGYVFYQRLQNPNQPEPWKKYYQSGLNEFNSIDVQTQDITFTSIASQIRALGQKMLQVEQQILYQFFQSDIDINDIMNSNLMDSINNILDLRDDYSRLLNQIKSSTSNQEKSSKVLKQINSTLTAGITEGIRDFIRTNSSTDYIMNGDYLGWVEALKGYIERGISNGLRDSRQLVTVQQDEDSMLWQDVISIIKKTESIFQKINGNIISRYRLNNVVKEVYNWRKQAVQQSEFSTKGLSSLIKDSTKVGFGSGSLSDALQSYISQGLSGVFSLNGAGARLNGASLSNELTLFNSQITVELDDIINSVYSNINNPSVDAEDSLEYFYNNYLSKLNDNFIIYGSLNDFSFNNKLSEINRTDRLSELPNFLNTIGLYGNGQDLVYKIYNTMSGAIGEGQTGSIEGELQSAIGNAIANYLFKDWNITGTYSKDAIYLFNIGGRKVPLSYLLLSIADSIDATQQAAASNVSFEINLPEGILYPIPVKAKTKAEVYAYWDRQRQDAENRSTFSVRFLTNFKGVLSQILGS